MSDDSDHQRPIREQRQRIEQTVARLIEARQAVNHELAFQGRCEPETAAQLNHALIDTISVLRIYRDVADGEVVDWESIGPAEMDPDEFEQHILTGGERQVPGGRGQPPTTAPVAADVELATQVALFNDLLSLARTLGFMPESDVNQPPVIAEAV